MSDEKTQQVIREMLVENTGVALCDSGGAYGRNYEANQARDFESEPEVSLRFDYGEVELMINLYHWLSEVLEWSEELTGEFFEFASVPEWEDESWMACAEGFVQFLVDERDATDLYGEGKPTVTNTYNHDSLLAQVIQYIYFELDGQEYVLLQIHGGCDVRGGYTKPQVFRCWAGDYPSILDDCRATLRPEKGEPYWDTDDGYHWYFEGTVGLDAGKELQEYDLTDNPDERGKGKIYYDGEGNGYCPLTGEKLVAYY